MITALAVVYLILCSGKTISFHHRLERELLDEIFCCTLEGGFISPSQHRSPLKLAMICKDWRDIALSLPKLWSSIYIRATNNKHVHPSLPLLQLWLARSQSLPLFFSFEIWEHTQPSSSNKLLMQFWNLLIPHAYRWHTVDLIVPDTPGDFFK